MSQPATTRGRPGRAAARALLVAGAALILAGPAAADGGVALSPQDQQRLGIATQTMVAAHRAAEIDAFAKVLDPGPLAQLDSDLDTAEAAAAASRAEAERSRALNAAGGVVAAKDAEAALAQARSDALHVTQLRRRLGLEWGPGVARLSDVARARLVADLASGRAALVHVDTHNNEGQAGARTVRVDIGSDSVTGTVIGAARAAEPRLQSSGLIVEVVGKDALLLSVGLTQSAHIQTAEAQSGVIAPRAALIRYRGSAWAYVRTGPGRFERRLLQTLVPGQDGVFVAGGLAAGDAVAVSGVPALFAAEQARAVAAP